MQLKNGKKNNYYKYNFVGQFCLLYWTCKEPNWTSDT